MKQLLEQIVARNRPLTQKGQVATYIPELSKADPAVLGVTAVDAQGNVFFAGDCHVGFTLQSISKPIALILALLDRGFDHVFSRIGMEPTGDSFNSLTKLETFASLRPLNPMINAGAIATTALIKGKTVGERFERILGLVRALAGNREIEMNQKVYLSEKQTGDRNRAIAYFLRDLGVLEGDVEETLDLYFRQCAIQVTCTDMAKIAWSLALGNENLPASVLRTVKTLMLTCGMYNASGEFAVRVGIPAKSGVSGGILAVVPERMGIGVIGPSLDEKGNSIAGIGVLADLSRELKLNIFQ